MYPSISPFTIVAFDLYRDVHKAIRVNLFDVTASAGRCDPHDRPARVELATRVRDLVDFLIFHAEHEDREMDGPIEAVLPARSSEINRDHLALETQMKRLVDIADLAFDATRNDDREAAHALYLALASFTSRYLAHQAVEEEVVMPALAAAFGIEELIAIHERIVTNIAPEQMGWSLVKMLPAMNIDDRVEMLAGMRMSAPPDAFEGVLALAADVLSAADYDQLTLRLGISDRIEVLS